MNIKKFSIILLSLCIILSVVGCAGNNTAAVFENVVVTTENSEYPSGVEHINITISNKTDSDIYYLPDFSVEEYSNKKWNTVKKDTEITEDIVCKTEKGDSVKETFNVTDYYNSLSTGKYRLVVCVSDDYDKLSAKESAAYAEFTIK